MDIRERFWHLVTRPVTPGRASVILAVLIAYSALILYFMRDAVGNDSTVYFNYFEGWKQGRYTYWPELNDYIPDTLRSPGYPFFIALLFLVSKNLYIVQFAQLICFGLSLIIIFRILLDYSSTTGILLLFACLLLFNPVIPLHNATIVPEPLTGFLLLVVLYIRQYMAESVKKYILLGILFGILFQVRPVVLFLPFLLVFVDWYLQRIRFRLILHVSMLVVFILSLLPYAYWNSKNHGKFSITPIEGGGGVAYLGYWGLKMPDYYETRYCYNGVASGLINFVDKKDIPENIRAFEAEWDYIDSCCAYYLTEKDMRNMAYMRADGDRFITYSGRYALERERLMKSLAFKHYLEDWPFTLKTKLFTVFRLWVTGIKIVDVRADDWNLTVKTLIAPVTTGLTLLMALVFVPWAFIRRKLDLKFWLPVLVTVAYWGLIHVPFAIQARYTIPVRLLFLALIAASIHGLFFDKKEKVGS